MLQRALAMPATVVALATILGSGCVMPDQVAQIQKDVADVRQELRRTQREQAQAAETLSQMQSRPAQEDESVRRSEFAELKLLLEEATRAAEERAAQIGDLNSRLDRLSRDGRIDRQPIRTSFPDANRGAPPNPLTPGPTGSESGNVAPDLAAEPGAQPDAESLYNTAYADFSKGNYAIAISGFENIRPPPDRGLADNALYWIGECHFSQGDFARAIAAFDRLLESYPRSDKAAAGNLKKALAFREQNQIGQAIVQFRYVMTKFPSSDEAKIARDQLTSLGAPI